MVEQVDAIVVGAGPAGATAAITLRRFNPGWRVLLLDKATFPRDKACGDAIAWHAFAELARLGVTGVEGDAPPIDELHLTGPDGTFVSGRCAHPNRVIRRATFDTRLVQHAIDAGAELVGHRVRQVTLDGDRVGVDGRWRAPWLVAADGANSVVHRHLGIPRPADRHRAIAVRAYADATPGQGHQRIDMDGRAWPSYAWSFPLADGRANVGYGLRVSAVEGHGRVALDTGLRLVAGGEVEAPRTHPLPLSSGRPRPDHGRVLLAGDAAGLINPLTGEGIFYAIASGRMAALAISRWPDGSADRRYRRMLRRRFGDHFATTSLLARLLDVKPLTAVVIRALHDPGAFTDLAEIGLGEGRMTARLATALARSVPTTAQRRRKTWSGTS